ncbi:MAG: HAMP domain-containing protein [Desulfohalobiaceae bacterium]|nr:HAMP domain-containing protein [Desulfohalobiaceae bacterium]
MKIRTKLTLLLILLAIVPLIVVAFLGFLKGRQVLEQETLNHLKATNILKKSELNRWVDNSRLSVEELAQRPLVRRYAALLSNHRMESAEYTATKTRLIEDHLLPGLKYGRFTELSLLCPKHGIILASTNKLQEGKYRDDQPYFLQGRVRTYVQNVYYSAVAEQPIMVAGSPILDKQGKLLGVLAGHFDFEELTRIMEQGQSLRPTEDTYLVNASHFFVTEPRFGQNYALKKTVHTLGVAACLSGENGVGLYKDYRGVPVLGAYQWIEEHQLGILTEIDQEVAFAPIHQMAWTIFWITMGVIAVAGIVGFFLARSLSRPVHALINGTREIARGNRTFRIGSNSQDEIGELSRAFDTMTRQLREKEQALDQQTIQLKAANQELESFAYSVSHDLRAPLRAIDGYARILEEDYEPVLDEEGRRLLGVICSEAARLGTLIDALLTYSRLGRTEIHLSRIDMATLAHSVFHELTTPEDRERIAFQAEDLPPSTGDPSLIRQVWTNLIANAVKYSTKQDSPRIRVSGEELEDEFVYSVQDNGAGFDMQYADKLFGVFQRLHSTKEFAGTGVGLANVQRAVLRHKGRVWAEGKVGKGAVFSFSLPKTEQETRISS